MAVEKLLLAKAEVTYGTDPVPVPADDEILTMGLEMLRYEGDRVERDVDKDLVGNNEDINTNPHTNTSFGIEFAGSGTAATPPAWGVLMTACGFDETIATDVQYQLPALNSDLKAADSVTLYDYREDGKVQKSSGVRGSVAIEMGKGSLPKLLFSNMLGSYALPIAGAMPTVTDWTDWNDPLPFTGDNVPTFTVDTFAACVESFNIDFGLEVTRRNLPGCASTLLTDYSPSGQVVIQAPDIGTKDFWTELESHDGTNLIAIAIVIGATAGAIVKIDASEVQISNIVEGESDGLMTYTMDLRFIDRPVITTA
jgi:hypothetical protein